jgi:DNA-binding XRE family transcriptional regulator
VIIGWPSDFGDWLVDRPVVSASEGAAMSNDQAGFSRGNEHLDRLLADPDTAAEVGQARAEIREMDRAHAMNLAMIRKAGDLTQIEMANRLGVGQGSVSRLENRDDMLLSTLFDYLTAAGAEGARIVVSIHGQEIDLDLAGLPHPSRA